jgi:hypothetical protein
VLVQGSPDTQKQVLVASDTLFTVDLEISFQLVILMQVIITLQSNESSTTVGMIIIEYNFPCGVQGPDHPNPGKLILKQFLN